MIKNQKQAAKSREKLIEIKEALDSLENDKDTLDPLEYELAKNSFLGIIKEIESQITLYDALVNGSFHWFKPKNLLDIPNILIAARLASKISQKDLADIVGVQEQQIQRYEANDYEGASWTRIIEVSKALKLQFYFEKIVIINSLTDEEEFNYPQGITMEQVEFTSEKIKKTKSLIFQ